jgi:hypothetical protein
VGILLIIGIILFILWLLGFFVFSLGALVHVALVIALILLIIWLAQYFKARRYG